MKILMYFTFSTQLKYWMVNQLIWVLQIMILV